MSRGSPTLPPGGDISSTVSSTLSNSQRAAHLADGAAGAHALKVDLHQVNGIAAGAHDQL